MISSQIICLDVFWPLIHPIARLALAVFTAD